MGFKWDKTKKMVVKGPRSAFVDGGWSAYGIGGIRSIS